MNRDWMATTHDDAFREIQLGGKQLVFLFMAVTVVSVVVFLCGVLVGRGVSAARGPIDRGAEASALSTAAVDATAAAGPGSAAGGPATSANEKLTYSDRLSSAGPTSEQLQAAEAPSPVAEAEAAAPPEPSKTPKTVPPRGAAETASASRGAVPPAARVAAGEPAGNGFAIQVAALRERAEADTIVARLKGKGYPAYVVEPTRGAPSVFRVRVGKFKTRQEADVASARLQKEEQFKPWLVR